MVDLELKVNAIDEATRASLVHVDVDLEALDGRVNRRRRECETTEAELRLAEGRIELLEEHLVSQRGLIEQLMARVDSMEGRLCRCGKGKGKEVEKDVSLLGSPLVLDCSLEEDINSDDSYHTPPVVSSSQPSSSSPYQDSDKENVSSFDIELDTKIALVPIGDAPPENAVAIPVREPTLNISGLERLVAVHGQCAFRSSGCPKSSFHPYLCPIGVRSSSHRRSDLCTAHPGSNRFMSPTGSDVGV